MKILVAVDGSVFSDAAVNQVAIIRWPAGSTVKALSVEEPLIAAMTEAWAQPDSYYEQAMKAEEARANTAEAKALSRLKSLETYDLEVIGQILKGFPKEAILEEAETWEADLIVLGSHGYKGLTRFLLGSVSNAVATHAKCSVMIVRTKDAGAS
ncbi:MAG TPA: universal stress protein [Blastocatellia bacterium]|nr:universal stress protein [Blastocatellia bacterium]